MHTIDFVSDEIARLAKRGLGSVLDEITEAPDVTMLRKLRNQYAKLSLEQIASVVMASGHRNDETDPCEVCRIISKQEMSVREE